MIDIFIYDNEEFNYCVYYHRNLKNNKLYIGISKDVTKRWKNNGKEYITCPYFWRAIEKYGWDGFEHVILIDNITKKEAELFEKELIKKYQTQDRNFGYNLASGGSGGCTIKGKNHWYSKPVYQYNLDGVFIREWENAQRAAEELKISVSDIHINCRKVKGIKKAGNYMWSYDKLTHMEKYKKDCFYCEPIFQLDKNFNIVNEYEDILHIDNMIFYRSDIIRCCNGLSLTTKGYYWCYKKDIDGLQECIKNTKKNKKEKRDSKRKHIFQCNISNATVIKEFITLEEVEEAVGINKITIQAYCNRPELHHGIHTGYYWCYKEDLENLEENIKKRLEEYNSIQKFKSIYQCDLNKNIIKKFRDAQEVSELIKIKKSTVRYYCAKSLTHGKSTGYYWVYVDDYEDFLKEET